MFILRKLGPERAENAESCSRHVRDRSLAIASLGAGGWSERAEDEFRTVHFGQVRAEELLPWCLAGGRAVGIRGRGHRSQPAICLESGVSSMARGARQTTKMVREAI